MTTMLEKTPNNQPSDKRAVKKASSNALPMIDLRGVLEFVGRIDSEGLQTLGQQDVSNRLGYAAHTSTPFYRRMVAAKLFGLIDTTQGVILTKLALDHFKPMDEDAKISALFTAVKKMVRDQRILK